MEAFKVIPGNSVYIGDNPSKDLIGAKKSGMRCILFRANCLDYNGFRPDACFQNYSELESIIEGLFNVL